MYSIPEIDINNLDSNQVTFVVAVVMGLGALYCFFGYKVLKSSLASPDSSSLEALQAYWCIGRRMAISFHRALPHSLWASLERARSSSSTVQEFLP